MGARRCARPIRATLGKLGLVQRCQLHKRRNVLEHLPEFLDANAERVLLQAWDAPKPEPAKRQLERFASSLEAESPGAAASIREGLDETLTLQQLGVTGALYTLLRTTNVIENLNGGVSRYARNVKRWRGGHMIIRWVGAALFELGKGLRRVRGFRDIDALYRALAARNAEMGLQVEQKVA